LTSERRKALVGRFRQSAREQLDVLDRTFVALEQHRDDSALANEVMRTIHTLKGDSKVVGFGQVNRVAHRTEDVLVWAKQRAFDVPANAADLVFKGFDLLRHLVVAEPADTAREPEIAEFEGRVVDLLGSLPAPVEKPAEPAPRAEAAPAAGPAVAAPSAKDEPKAAAAQARPAESNEWVRVATEHLSTLTSLAGTLLVRQEQIESRLVWLDGVRRQVERAVSSGTEDPEPLMRELGQGIAALQSESFEARMHLLSVQEEVRQMRLRQMGDLFERYPRAVRDLAHAQGKSVRVEQEGTEVAVDKQVLDQLDKVLLHLVRNAVDHGLETPGERVEAGKSPEGTLRLCARPVGGQIEVCVADDGRGMDPARIRAAAVRRGMLGEAEAARSSDAELVRMVFQPGFSTREQATDVSGRGIGLDVVTKLTEQLGGSVRVENEPGKGCRFFLTLPVSLALTQVLLVEAGGRTFAVPAVSVVSALRAPAGAARPSGEGLALPVDGALTPLVDLAALLGLPVGHAADEDLSVAVVEGGSWRLALRVARFMGQRSVVVAALDPFLAGVRVVSGTAELEGGRRVLLLSMPEIFKLSTRGMIGRHRDEAARRKRVLIVDDSPIIREVMGPILERLGYQVIEAGNGREGFERACGELPDLVMTDIEMPILDGFGLIEKLRSADAAVRGLPVVVLSTRGAEADKRRAMQAGANAYLVKTHFDEGELSRTLRSLLT
jgi:chemotaxis protein histidine kinase CheA/CheY-like chemotaxis protein